MTVLLEDHPELKDIGGAARLTVNSKPAVLIREGEEDFRALSLECTHHGCEVKWVGGNEGFACPCHGSRFDAKGRVSEGPARRSLYRFKTAYDKDRSRVTISW
jgi:Rieske Fe-S protein